MGLIPKFLLTRTPMCKHKYSCYENVILGLYRTFRNTLLIKLVLNNLAYITNFNKLIKNLMSWKSNKDNLRFALFLALMNALYKSVLCLLRRVCKNDKINAPIAGFIAGLASSIEDKNRRQLLTVLLFSRFADTTYSLAESRGYVSRFPYGEMVLWMMCNIL